MAGFVTDNAFEIELNKMLTFLENIKKEQTIFMNVQAQLPPKERAQRIKNIEASHKKIFDFVGKAKQEENYNSGIKFKLENLKAKYASLTVLWRKIVTPDLD